MSEGSSNHKPNSLAATFHLDEGINFTKLLGQIYRHIWLVLGVSLVCCFIAFLHALTLRPQYQSAALMQIKSQSTNTSMLNSIGYKAGISAASAETQIALIRTRYILEPVVIQAGLNIIVNPHLFPVIGTWMYHHHAADSLAKPLFGLKAYAWGGETIEIKRFLVPHAYEGHGFRLVAGENGSYQLFANNNQLILTGKVGEVAVAADGSGIELELTQLAAHPGTEFTLSYQSPVRMSDSLARALKVKSLLGNDILQSTGVIELQLTGANPEQIVKTLNAIVRYTVAKNVQQKAQETQKTLEFLNQRLPEVKNNLVQAEDAINQYHIRTNTLSMNIVSQMLSKQMQEIQQATERLKIQKEELLQVYTPQHPLIAGTERKLAAMKDKLTRVKAHIKQFPIAFQTELDLQREAKIKYNMYLALLNSRQQLQMVKASVVPDIIALTDATPPSTLAPHRLLAVLCGLFIGLFLSITFVLIRTLLNKTVEDASQLENLLNIPIQCVIPFSRKQKQLERNAEKARKLGTAGPSSLLLARHEPQDISVESLRSLRISLHIMAPDTAHRTIALMGSLSGIGKSFVSLNLAQVMAESGKRTILIDADVRKGRVHNAFFQTKSPGLSEYLEGKVAIDHLIRRIDDNFSFISCGLHNNHPLELFQNQRFIALLDKVKSEFDQVIIDTPPILAVADSILIAKHCDTKLFVVSAGKDTISEVKQAIKKADAHGIKVNGIVFNHRKPLLPYGSPYYYRYAYGTTTA